jgi:hypothetical protein
VKHFPVFVRIMDEGWGPFDCSCGVRPLVFDRLYEDRAFLDRDYIGSDATFLADML